MLFLLTKNSLKPCLRECLNSIYSNVPVNRLLVVDGGSIDGTLDVVNEYPNVEVIYDKSRTERLRGKKA